MTNKERNQTQKNQKQTNKNDKRRKFTERKIERLNDIHLEKCLNLYVVICAWSAKHLYDWAKTFNYRKFKAISGELSHSLEKIKNMLRFG